MSDPSTQELGTEAKAPEDESAVIKELREKANRTQAAEAEAEALRREMAFDRAGVPTEGPAKWFRQGYEGEITPEAIRSAAEADGLLAPPTAQPTTPADPTGPSDAAAISAAMNGGEALGPVDLNAKLREAGKDGYGDQKELDQAILDLNLTDADFERIARQPYVS